MPNSPKENEEKMLMVLNGWKTLAPTKTFGGFTLEQYETQVNKVSRRARGLDQIEDEKRGQQALRESEDLVTIKDVQFIVNGVLSDAEFGDDSALYEAMGYIRKSNRKSGLTRKKKEPAKD